MVDERKDTWWPLELQNLKTIVKNTLQQLYYKYYKIGTTNSKVVDIIIYDFPEEQ